MQNSKNQVVKFELSNKMILLIIGGVLVYFFREPLWSVFIVLFFALVTSSATLPIIKKLESWKVSKVLSVIIVYLSLIAIIIASLSLIIVPVVNELKGLQINIPTLTDQVLDKIVSWQLPFLSMDRESLRTSIIEYLMGISQSLMPIVEQGFSGILASFKTLAGVFGILLSLFSSLVISIYLTFDKEYYLNVSIFRYVKKETAIKVRDFFGEVESKLGSWFLGQIILCFIIGFMTWVGLSLFRVPFALPLAILAGFMEAVPNLGPILSAIPAVVVAFVVGGPAAALGVLIMFVVIQQFENHLLVPRIMGSVVGLRPSIVLIGMLVGYSLAGVLGAIITVPMLTIGTIFLAEYKRTR